MVQLIALLLLVAALVILVLQNLTPVVGLVVLGVSVGALPVSVWLLGAIATGVLCTLIIYQLVPQKRAYRPIGKRLSDPAPEPTRFVNPPVDTPMGMPDARSSNAPSGRFQQSDRQNPYDSDWENFRAPEQWDDWGQKQPSEYVASNRPRPSVGDAVDDTFKDIESGWGDDDYETSARYASRQETSPDIGWDDSSAYDSSRVERLNYEPRTYEEGWLYGNDAPEEPLGIAEPGEPRPDDPDESVYDANYRVIIPPYDVQDKDS